MIKMFFKRLLACLLISGGTLYTQQESGVSFGIYAEGGYIIEGIREVYKEYGIDASHIDFGRTEDSGFATGPAGTMAAAYYIKGRNYIILSPHIEKLIIKALETQQPFDAFVKYNLFHEFAHVLYKHTHKEADSGGLHGVGNKYEEFLADTFAFNKFSVKDLNELALFIKEIMQSRESSDPDTRSLRDRFLQGITRQHPELFQRLRMIANATKRNLQKEKELAELQAKLIQENPKENKGFPTFIEILKGYLTH